MNHYILRVEKDPTPISPKYNNYLLDLKKTKSLENDEI
jgi:hypothetical protein